MMSLTSLHSRVCNVVAAWLWPAKPQQPAEMTAPAAPEAPIQEYTALIREGWFALPGCRLEYRDSGLAIALATQPGHAAYTLLDSEGQPLAATGPGLLERLQVYAEIVAAERAAFVYHPASKDAHG